MPVKNVDEYIKTHHYWEKELNVLRELMNSTGLEETIKWGAPVYMLKGKNVVGFVAFKNHCAIWIYQGALLKENTALLYNAQKGKTKGLRQIQFKKGDPIEPKVLKNYVLEAIEIEKAGKRIKPDYNKKLIIPPEFKAKFKDSPDLEKSFSQLTKGRQREYAEYIIQAKRAATKQRRLEKICPMIAKGIGLNDKYK